MIFDEKSTRKCQSIIQKLAKTFQSVSFTPHITLSGTPDWAEDHIQSVTEKAIEGCLPLQLSTKSVHCSSNPYQKLTHAIQKTDPLRALHQKMDTCFDGDFAKKAYPHISYLYSKLSCERITSEIESFQKDTPKKVIANQLALVRCKGTPDMWRTVCKWTLKN